MAELYVRNVSEISDTCLAALSGQRLVSAAANVFAKQVLAEQLGVSAASVEFARSEHGKPRLLNNSDLFFNISHSGDMLALAVSSGKEVGVDIQRVVYNERVAKRVFTQGEIRLIESSRDKPLAFTKLWSLKESWLKARGTGFAGNSKEIELFSADNPILTDCTDYEFSVSMRGNYVVAVCVQSV